MNFTGSGLNEMKLQNHKYWSAALNSFFRRSACPRPLHRSSTDNTSFDWGDTIIYRDNSISIVKKLRGKVSQYVVSNGTIIAQKKKLLLSGLGELMDGVFLSEEIGAEKPNRAFFDAVFDAIRPSSLSEVMMIGDSLTSDIQGGNNAGILTCWYNPDQKPAPLDYDIDYIITDLHEVISLVEAAQ